MTPLSNGPVQASEASRQNLGRALTSDTITTPYRRRAVLWIRNGWSALTGDHGRMSRQRRHRSDAALTYGVEGTDYGFRQLLHAGVLLSDDQLLLQYVTTEPEQVQPWATNALIESFLANARRIGWFLHDAPAGDAFAGDYLSPVGWDGWPDAEPIIGLVSDVLSHSKYLAKPEPYKWRSMTDPLAAGMVAFIDRLDSVGSKWHSAFASLAVESARLLPRIHDV